MSSIAPSRRKQIIDHEVSRLLEKSEAYGALSPEVRREVHRDTAEVVERLSGDELVEEIDFPSFVRDLIEGVFHAIVDGSIQQMKAYAELVEAVAQSLADFEDASATPHRGLDPARRQLLSSMLLMGINRIVVTDGKINAKIRFALVDDATYSRRIAACQSCPRLVDPPVQPGRAGKGKVCSLTGGFVEVMARLASERCPDPDPADPGRSRWGDLRG